MNSTATQLIELLREGNWLISTIESCTGGLIADHLTDIPGSSEAFWGTTVVYDYSAKEALGVPVNVLLQEGAVSAPVARITAEKGIQEMKHALEVSHTSSIRDKQPRITVSTTGIAGPSGGTPMKPVGLCFVGICIDGVGTEVFEIHAPKGNSRRENKEFFAQRALELALWKLEIHMRIPCAKSN